ncbi:MAG: class I SAM-dependent methyltransferase [Casimicrobiaceae bacterium]
MNLDDAATAVQACTVCGGHSLKLLDILPPELVEAWELAPDEVRYVNRQQGLRCVTCGSTLRCMTLAAAILRLHGYRGCFADFAASDDSRTLDILEVNEAGGLTNFLATMPNRRLATYPDVDMQALPFADRAFDLVVHSDTLEHVADPLLALAECRRVLRPGGACAFTVPLIVGRLSRNRAGLAASYHGTAAAGDQHRVHTEFGADAWRFVIRAGFAECRIVAIDSPAAHALVGIR